MVVITCELSPALSSNYLIIGNARNFISVSRVIFYEPVQADIENQVIKVECFQTDV